MEGRFFKHMIFSSKKQLFWPLFFYPFIYPSSIRNPPALFSLFAKNREPKKNEKPRAATPPQPHRQTQQTRPAQAATGKSKSTFQEENGPRQPFIENHESCQPIRKSRRKPPRFGLTVKRRFLFTDFLLCALSTLPI